MKKRSVESLCFDVLAHEIRREIISLLYNRIEMSYTELLKTLNIGDGLLNFHLKKMKDFITKTENGTYILTEKGRLAYNLIHTVRSFYDIPPLLTPASSLNKNIVLRRILAFIADAVIFFIFTGVFLDPQLWDIIFEAINHLNTVIELHPWIFHLEHLTLFGEATIRLVGIYSHVFFAVYIFLTLLEAYKGQTPGKYLFRIRVVKIGGLKLGLIESAIRNAGKVFLLPLDLIVGVLLFGRKGFIRFFDYYTDSIVEKVI